MGTEEAREKQSVRFWGRKGQFVGERAGATDGLEIVGEAKGEGF
jgi:hypothetical protein